MRSDYTLIESQWEVILGGHWILDTSYSARALGQGVSRKIRDSHPSPQPEAPRCARYASEEANGDSAMLLLWETWKPLKNANLAIR